MEVGFASVLVERGPSRAEPPHHGLWTGQLRWQDPGYLHCTWPHPQWDLLSTQMRELLTQVGFRSCNYLPVNIHSFICNLLAPASKLC